MDILDRSRPQPEVSYLNSTNDRLVIERKTVVWPLDYVQRHVADHFFAAQIMARLKPLLGNARCILKVPSGFCLSHMRLSEFAESISKCIKDGGKSLMEGRKLKCRDPLPSAFRFQEEYERYNSDPATGLCISFQLPESDNLYDSDNIPEGLQRQFMRLLRSTERKFERYTDSRRILLIEPHGDVQCMESIWWKTLSDQYCSDESIEIWIDEIDDSVNQHLFMQVFPTQLVPLDQNKAKFYQFFGLIALYVL